MNFTPVDQSLRMAIEAIERNPIIHLKFEDHNKKDRLLTELILQSFYKGERVLFLCDNPQLKAQINAKLGQYKLSMLSLEMDHSQNLSEGQLTKIRTLGKSKITNKPRIGAQFIHDVEDIKIGNNQIKSNYQNLLDDKSIDQARLTSLNKALSIEDKSSSIKNIISIEKETLVKLSKFYQKSFNILEKGDPFKQNFYKQIGLDEQTIPIVRFFNDEIKNLKKEYRSLDLALNLEYKNKLDKHYNQNLNSYECIKSFLREHITLESREGGLVSRILDKKKKTDWTIIESKVSSLAKDLDFDVLQINKDSVSDLLKEWEDQKAHYFGNKEKEIKAIIKQLNCRNSGKEELKEFNERLNDLATKMNTSDFFTTEIENNAWNFSGQFNTIKQINQIMGNAIYLLDNPEYVYWRIVLNELTASQRESLSELKSFPVNEWITVYERSTTIKELSSIYPSQLPEQENLNTNAQLIESLVSNLHLYVEQNYLKNKEEKLKELDKSNKSLYNTLFRKKNNPEISWESILEGNDSFVSQLFPFMITDSKLLDTNCNYHWDKIFLYNTTTPLDVVRLSKLSNSIINLNDDTLFELDGENEADQLLTVQGYLSTLTNSIESLEEKTANCKPLAKQIRNYASNLRIYQSKEVMVISFLNDSKNKKFLQVNESEKLKELTLLAGEEDLLEEAFIHNIPIKIIVTENGLIHQAKYEDWNWQLEIISKLKFYGFLQLNIDDKDVLLKTNYSSFKITRAQAKQSRLSEKEAQLHN